MRNDQASEFQRLLTDALAFYGKDVSTFALSVWWEACQPFDMEQVRKAMTTHATDPEHGQFAPKPADIVKALQGTKTDRARQIMPCRHGILALNDVENFNVST